MKKLITTITTSLLLAACGGSDTDLETAFCIGLGQEASATATAAAAAADAPTVALGDQRTDLELVPVDGGQGGAIVFVADEEGFFAFGLGEDVPLKITDASGADVPLVESVRGSEMCTELAVRHTAELRAAPYTLTFGPSSTTTLPIVAEESDDDVTP